MNDQSFEDTVMRICDANGDYDPEAYWFLREGLDRTVRALGRDGAKNRHVSGKELCEGLRDYALDQFGPLALLVLTQWGVYETSDFGEMVMELVQAGVFGKRGGESKADFDGVFSFEEAFLAPFEPPEPRQTAARTSASARKSTTRQHT